MNRIHGRNFVIVEIVILPHDWSTAANLIEPGDAFRLCKKIDFLRSVLPPTTEYYHLVLHETLQLYAGLESST